MNHDFPSPQGSDNSGMIGASAKTLNMTLALDTMASAVRAEASVPRMCLFYGPSGFGKSTVCSHVAAMYDAAYVEARSVWTGKTFLQKLAQDLGIAHLKRNSAEIMDQIVEALAHAPRPIVIDEMDHLVSKKSVDAIRDIYDATGVPIMMVGEEALPAKLKEWERFDNRILKATAAQPSSFEDGRLLRDLYARRVKIDDDLVDHFTRECRGIARRIVVNLQEAQRVAIDDLGVVEIGLNRWGNRPVVNGDLPLRRAGGAR